MEAMHNTLIELFFNLTPLARDIFIFVLAFGEGLPVIGTFLPGGTIAILIGSLSEEGFINAWKAIHLIAVGSLLGDLIGFFVGRKLLHLKWVQKIVDSEKHAKKWDLFDRHAALIIILGKIVPVIRSTPSLFAGVRKMNIFKYSFYVLIGSYLWAITGIFGGKYLQQLFGDFSIVLIILILLVSATMAFISFRKK